MPLELRDFVPPVVCQLKSPQGLQPAVLSAKGMGCVFIQEGGCSHQLSAPPADREAAGSPEPVPGRGQGQGQTQAGHPFTTPASGMASGVGSGTQRGEKSSASGCTPRPLLLAREGVSQAT